MKAEKCSTYVTILFFFVLQNLRSRYHRLLFLDIIRST
jgi:hypothetical protein